MAGKFISTKYYDTQDSLVKMNQDLVKNPFYLYNDKKGTKVKYYNINTEKTTLDPGSKLAYTDIGDNSPIRFNVIHDLYLYQFIKMELNFDNGEFGLENNPITGESYILPNTIVPVDGDYFEVDHIKDSTWLFKVTDVQRDVLDNGSNVYKIGWTLDRTTNRDILKNVVEEYKYYDSVEGSNLKSVVKLERYNIAEKLDQLSSNLANYFKDLFYNTNVQTFIYKWYNEYNMYDPFAIEFIIRNRILSTSDEYIHVQHQCPVPNTFSIDYNRSFFRAIEERSIKKLAQSQIESQADYIDYKAGIFQTRFEPYWCLNYKVIIAPNSSYNPKGVIPLLDKEFVDKIIRNEQEDLPCYKKIIVKFFNNEDLYKEDLENIECIDLEPSKNMFYLMLILIYCVDFYTKTLLS